jgi:hypothetical protein
MMPRGDLWGPAARARARNEAETLRYERERAALQKARRDTERKVKARGKFCTECADLSEPNVWQARIERRRDLCRAR